MKTLLVTRDAVSEVVEKVGLDRIMDELIHRLGSEWRGYDPAETIAPARTGFHYEVPVSGMVEWMPLHRRGRDVLMKVVGYHPDNPHRAQLPTVLSTIGLYDTTNGHLKALVDGTLLTAMRTGAASAVASRSMARPDSSTLGLIGAGAQAVTQLHALTRVFSISEVLIHDIDRHAERTFPRRVDTFLSDEVEVRSAEPGEIVECCDIVSVATSVRVGEGPVFREWETLPWVHVNAVGSDFPGKTELPKELLEGSYVCADTLAQARIEGECQQLAPEDIDAELADVLRGATIPKDLRERRTVFDSTGWALQDQVAVELLLELARELDLGTWLSLESVEGDPKAPYEFLASARVLPMPAPRGASGSQSMSGETGSRSSG